MEGQRRRQPAASTAADRVGESPDAPASAQPIRNLGVRYDPDELFPDSPRLSDRERETLELLADGKPNAVIATVLGKSKRTVEDFIAGIVQKLDVSDRAEAAAAYHRAVEAKLERENRQLIAQVRALEGRIAVLRRQLRRRS